MDVRSQEPGVRSPEPSVGTRTALPRPVAVGALMFGVLVIVSGATTGHPPDPDQTVAKILSWYRAHRVGTFTMEVLLAVAGGLLVWIAAGIRRSVAGRTDGSPVTADCLLATSGALAALFVAGGWAQLALAVSAGRPGASASGSLVHMLSDVSWLRWGGIEILLAVAAVSLAAVARNALKIRTVTWISGIAAVLSFVGGIVVFYPDASGAENPLGVLGFLGMVLFAVALMALGVAGLARRTRPEGQLG